MRSSKFLQANLNFFWPRYPAHVKKTMSKLHSSVSLRSLLFFKGSRARAVINLCKPKLCSGSIFFST